MNRLRFTFLTVLTSFAVAASILSSQSNVINVSGYTNNDASTYYQDIESSYKTRDELLTALRELNSSKRRNLIPYSKLGNYFSQTDPGTRSGQITSFYSGVSSSQRMTREHVWPYSRLYLSGYDEKGERIHEGDNEIEQDLQMVRPSLYSENVGRGNSFYVEGMDSDRDGWDPANLGDETYRGDAARIIFYSVAADSNLRLVDSTDDFSSNHTMGKLSNLLEWNLKYAVSARENVRNEAVESLQGHRNPFIDHPEYACRIWGNYNSTTKSICSNYGSTTELDVKVDNESIQSIELQVGDTVNFVSSSLADNNVTYSFAFSDYRGIEHTTDVANVTVNNNTASLRALKASEVVYLKAKMDVNLPNEETESLYKLVKLVIRNQTVVSELRVVKEPNQTEYAIGESFNPSGMKVTAYFTDGSYSDVTEDITYDTSKFKKAGYKYVSIYYTYRGNLSSTSFKVWVYDDSPDPDPSGGGSGCGGNIITSSVLLFSLSSISILLVSISKRRKSKK